MERWLWVTLLLCAYGFLREVRPSESFLTQYLEEFKNLTSSQVNNEIYPVWTYSYLVLLFVVLLITDFFRYKPLIVIEGLAYIVTWVLLLWAQGVLAMQFMEFSYGVVTATEVAYYTYIYAKIAPEHYKKATGFVRAATLFGKFLSGTLAQILVSTHTLDYHQLNYISLGDVSVAFMVALCLPSVSKSIYFHQKKEKVPFPLDHDGPLEISVANSGNTLGTTVANSGETLERIVTNSDDDLGTDLTSFSGPSPNEPTVALEKEEYERVPCAQVFRTIWSDFKSAYTDSYQLKWCLWWTLGTCSYEQVGNYIQTLWEYIYPSQDHQDLYNGAVDAINTLLGALVATSIGFLPLDWDKWGELTLGAVSLVQGAMLMIGAVTTSIWVAYAIYIVYVTFYYLLITVASYQVAKRLERDSYGLVFGCNQFFALILQALMTVIVVDKRTLNAEPPLQFLVYGGYTMAIGVLFLGMTFYTGYKSIVRRRKARQ